MTFRRRRITALTSAALVASGLLLGVASPVAAYNACPSGWTQVTTTQVAHLTTFCRQGAGFGNQDRYVLIAPKESVGQALTLPGNDPNHPWGSAGNPDPQYTKRSVSSWMSYLRGFWGSSVQVVINGNFYDDTSGSSTSSISYPIFQTNQLVEAAKAPGSEASYRRCLAWGSTFNPVQYTWAYAGYDWAGVSSYGNSNCSTSNPYHRIVALDPTYGSDTNALTMVGVNGASMCFLVGGWQTRAQAVTMLSSFGCTAKLQLDGGHSSQLSYYAGGQVDALTGYFPIYNRAVPHVIVFF
jgi:hypothetical protein